MKVGFNARLLHDGRLRGWNRYTSNLLAELPACGVELVLYTEKPIHPTYLERLPAGSYTVRRSPGLPYALWEQAWLPRQCEVDRVDLLHSPFNFGLPWSSPCKRVLTLHDAIDWVYYAPSRPFLEKLGRRAIESRLYHWIARTRADHVITVSEFSKSDLVCHLGLETERITVIYEAADARFSQTISERDSLRALAAHRLEKKYVFYVGGWERRKNLPLLLEAFAKAHVPGVELVLAGGGHHPGESAKLADQARELGFADRLRLLGHIDDADLPALYANALAFVYPSEYEGFGLQLCEAMAAGCPTLAAKGTCLPEILGFGGETFPLDDSAPLARLLERLVTAPECRADLSRRARTRSKDFSWSKAAQETVGVYRSLLA